jgi:hypothetical protein
MTNNTFARMKIENMKKNIEESPCSTRFQPRFHHHLSVNIFQFQLEGRT